jgi:hypothetical protein
VVACVVDDAGRPWLEVIAHRPGRSWAAGYLRDRLAKWPGASVAVLRNSPAGPIADALELAGVPGEEGQWVWSNARSTGDISALSAGTLAAWLALRAPAPAPAPVAIFA